MTDNADLIKNDPMTFLDNLLDPAVQEHWQLAQGVSVDDGYDAWLDGVVDLAEDDVIPGLERAFADAEVEEEFTVHFDHDTGAWSARLLDGKGQTLGETETDRFGDGETLRESYELLAAEA